MSKSAEDRIAELEGQLGEASETVDKMKANYNTVYSHMQQAEQAAMYYKGKLEAGVSDDSSLYGGDDSGSVDDTSSELAAAGLNGTSSRADISNAIDRIVASRIEPRLEQVERFASDALQQTAGREVDRALESFKNQHPETSDIMDFERLVLLDASDEIRRRTATGEHVDDIKELAVSAAKHRVGRFNKEKEERTKMNQERRESAQKKAMLPDIFSAAGFEEPPSAPKDAQEAGDLLESLVRAKNRGASL